MLDGRNWLLPIKCVNPTLLNTPSTLEALHSGDVVGDKSLSSQPKQDTSETLRGHYKHSVASNATKLSSCSKDFIDCHVGPWD